jgi:hypothetical protein
LVSEDFFKSVRQFLKCRGSSALVDHNQLIQPAEEQLSCEDRLYNIGSIEAIHAVGSEDTLLEVFADRSLILTILRNFNIEVSIVFELAADLIQQLGEVLVLHVLALCVEIEPHQIHSLVFGGTMHFVEVLAQSALGALLVDQIDEATVLIVLLDIVVVLEDDITV